LTVFLARQLTFIMMNQPGLPMLYQVGPLRDLAFAFFLCLSWVMSTAKLGLYSSKRTAGFPAESAAALSCLFLSTAVAVLIFELLFNVPHRRFFYCTFAGLSLGLIILGRILVIDLLQHRFSSGKGRRKMLVVGRNPGVNSLLETILENPHYGIDLVGVIDAPKDLGHLHPCADRSLPAGVPELGTSKDLDRILSREAVDEVLVLLPMRSFYNQVEEVLKKCEAAGVVTKILPDLFNVNIARRTISWVGDVPFLTYFTGPRENLELAIKRALDFTVSLVLLSLCAPVFIAVGLAVMATSPGPVFFRQIRSGLNGRPFTLLKFRTMYMDAEERKKELEAHNEMSGPVFKMQNDPRVTPVGRFLRRYSLDELPQLCNILAGHMSLVGPRPPIPAEVQEYEWWQRRRLSMRPGLTCNWQVSGRNEIEFEEWMEMDLSYIDNWSLALDFMLLLRTLPDRKSVV